MVIQKKIKELIEKGKEVVKTKPKSKLAPQERESLLKKISFPEESKHQHLWKIFGKTYAPPTNLNLTNVQNIPSEIIERAMFGLTTLLWECNCGETKREELLGSDEDLLESLIDKADKIGPQFVERRGKSFIVSEWKPQDQNPNMIPVK